jgi:hypothetical protein
MLLGAGAPEVAYAQRSNPWGKTSIIEALSLIPPRFEDGADPCPGIGHPSSSASEAEWNNALVELGRCANEAMKPVRLMFEAVMHFQYYARSATDRRLSAMSDLELLITLRAETQKAKDLFDARNLDALRGWLRTRFDDRDLDELARLNRRYKERLKDVERLLFAAVDMHRGLFERFASRFNRYELLLLLRDLDARGSSPEERKQQVIQFMSRQRGMVLPPPGELASFPGEMLSPWGVLAVLPDEGRETSPLNPDFESPFRFGLNAIAWMMGPDDLVSKQRRAYVALRDSDNPVLPLPPAPLPDAVRVAILDSGVDFVQQPKLTQVLSDARVPGMMGSYDYQDDDLNPFLSASDSKNGHGTGTTTSFVRVLSHYSPKVPASSAPDAPRIFPTRKLDLAVWKVRTIRDQLATPYSDRFLWENRNAAADAIVRQVSDSSGRPKPQIVSVSMKIALFEYLRDTGNMDAVLKAPWLWVMAAGNQGGDRMDHLCLSDIPQLYRRDEQILCVGALERGFYKEEEQIAYYSNRGERVDLYAFETYSEVCPNGTSCSTPAITAVAAAVLAEYPWFTADILKEILLMSASWRTLPIGPAPGQEGMPIETQKVRVLDPSSPSTMPKVMRVAKVYARKHPRP